jgi:AcrR family transcriptional regulator
MEAHVPTGVAIREVRAKLFDAAERVLLRAGAAALTSRAVTAEADVAKGVRHFADFDAFLAELVADRIARVDTQAAALRESAGTGTVTGNVTDALIELFGPLALSIVGLLIYRDGLRARMRDSHPAGIPYLAEGVRMLVTYLSAERDAGRIAADADVHTPALMLIGSGHMLFAGQSGALPDRAAVHEVVEAALVGAIR